MNITRIETFPVALPLVAPFEIANARFAYMYYVVIKVSTDEGITGYGESIPAWEVTGETQFSVIDCISHLTDESKLGFTLLGRPVRRLEHVRDIMNALHARERAALFAGAPAAKAGLEQALLDIVGKTEGKSTYEVLGGRPRDVEFGHVLGIEPAAETLARARALIEGGVSKIKVKVGVEGAGGMSKYQRDVEVVLGIKRLIEDSKRQVALVADANQGFVTAARATAFLRAVEGCLDYIEQPILAGDYMGLCEIKGRCGVAIMADEALHSYRDAQVLVALDAVDLFNVKLMKCGGIFEALRIAGLARRHNKRVVLGSMLESQLGAVASIHAFFCDDIFEATESGFFTCLRANVGRGLSVRDRQIHVPDGPGNGIDVDEPELLRHLVKRQQSKTVESLLQLYSVQRRDRDARLPATAR